MIIQDLVREGRISAYQGAMLLELRQELRDVRERKRAGIVARTVAAFARLALGIRSE